MYRWGTLLIIRIFLFVFVTWSVSLFPNDVKFCLTNHRLHIRRILTFETRENSYKASRTKSVSKKNFNISKPRSESSLSWLDKIYTIFPYEPQHAPHRFHPGPYPFTFWARCPNKPTHIMNQIDWNCLI